MNNVKLNIYKKYPKKYVSKFDGAEEFIADRIEEYCNNEKLSVEEVT